MARRRDDDEDDDDRKPAPKSDAYVGLMVITLLAVLAGSVLMFMDNEELMASNPTPPAVSGSPAGLEYLVGGR